MKNTMPTVLVAVTLVATACGGTARNDTTTTTAATGTTTTSETTSTTAEPTATTTTTTTTTTTITTTTTAPLPGEPIDIGPRNGDELTVIGVAHDDVLNVRSVPGLGGAIIGTLAPTSGGITALGNNRLLPSSIWFQVDTADAVGWASGSFLAFEGFTDDITPAVVAALGGIPIGTTVEDLADIVARTRASTEPASRITTTVAATAGDLYDITLDVIGLGDDAVAGERLHVFATPLDGGGFELNNVERTLLCSRSVTEDGLCV